jgi:DNA-binding NtrC family response regulator
MRFQLWREEMKAKILVIDDEEIIRLTIEGFLSKEGYEVLTADGYTSAMEVIYARP